MSHAEKHIVIHGPGQAIRQSSSAVPAAWRKVVRFSYLWLPNIYFSIDAKPMFQRRVALVSTPTCVDISDQTATTSAGRGSQIAAWAAPLSRSVNLWYCCFSTACSSMPRDQGARRSGSSLGQQPNHLCNGRPRRFTPFPNSSITSESQVPINSAIDMPDLGDSGGLGGGYGGSCVHAGRPRMAGAFLGRKRASVDRGLGCTHISAVAPSRLRTGDQWGFDGTPKPVRRGPRDGRGAGRKSEMGIVVPADDASHVWGASRVGALARMPTPYQCLWAI